MKRKVFGLLLCIGLTVGVLTGCGSEGTDIIEDSVLTGEEKVEEEAGNAETGEGSGATGEGSGAAGESSGAAGEGSKAAEEDSGGTEEDNKGTGESGGDAPGVSTEQREEDREAEEVGETAASSCLIREIIDYGSTRFEKEYDIDGNILKNIYYGMDGTVSQWEEYTYDADGNNVRQTMYNTLDSQLTYHPEGIVTGWYEYEYDGYGNMTRNAYFAVGNEEPSMDQRIQNEYDADGRLIRRTAQNADGTDAFRQEYEYDSNGNLVRDESTDDVGVVLIEYDGFGNVTKELGPSGGGMYEYDAHGNTVKSTSLDGDGNETGSVEYQNEYDASGNRIRWTAYVSGQMSGRGEDEYDENGNLIKWTAYNSQGTVSQWGENEYDESGNRIKMTSGYGEGEVSQICEYEYATF